MHLPLLSREEAACIGKRVVSTLLAGGSIGKKLKDREKAAAALHSAKLKAAKGEELSDHEKSLLKADRATDMKGAVAQQLEVENRASQGGELASNRSQSTTQRSAGQRHSGSSSGPRPEPSPAVQRGH